MESQLKSSTTIECVNCGQVYPTDQYCLTDECKRIDKAKRRSEYRRDPLNYLDVQKRLEIPKLFLNAHTRDFKAINTWPVYQRSIFVRGEDTGTGKTHYAVAGFTKWFIDNDVEYSDVIFMNVANLMLELRESFKLKKKSEAEIVRRLSNTKFLVLDDFGAEKMTEYSLASLYIIINDRSAELRPTIVTTNLQLEEIHNVDPRLASRFSAYEQVYLMGKDRRIGEK